VRRSVYICLFLTLAMPAAAADPDPVREAVLPAGCDNALLIEDIPGHLIALLRSKHAQRLMQEGILATWLARSGTSADTIIAKVENPALPIPMRLALGMPRQGWDDLATCLRLGVRQGLLQSATDHADDESLQRLRAECLTELQAMRVPPLCVVIDFRNPMMGQQIGMMVGGYLKSTGFAESRVGDTTTYRSTLGDLVDPEVLQGMAVGLKLTDALDDVIAVETGRILAAKQLHLELRPRAAGIAITIGTWPIQADAVPAPAKADFLAVRWEVTGLRTAVVAAQTWWNTWDGTPLGIAAAKADTEDLIGSLRRTAAQMEQIAAAGEATMAISSDGFTFVATGSEPMNAPTIGASGLTTLVPEGSAYVHYEGAADIGTWIGDQLTAFEERADRKSMQATVRGNEVYAEGIKGIIATYYRQFGDLRTLVMDHHAEFFLPGLVLIGETGGRLDQLEIVRTKPKESGFLARDVPVPAFALIGRPRTAESGADFFIRLADAGIAPLYRIGGQIAPATLTKSIATPGGIPGLALESGWIDAIAAEWRIRASGESMIHAATVDGWFVLSTSLTLTDRIRAAIRAARPGPGINPEAYLQGTIRGEAASRLALSYRSLLEDPQRLVGVGKPLFASDQERDKVLQIVAGTAEILSLFGDLSWIGRNVGTGRRFEMHARFVMPTLSPATVVPDAIP